MLTNAWKNLMEWLFALMLLALIIGFPICALSDFLFKTALFDSFAITYFITIIVSVFVYIPILYVLMLIDVFTCTSHKWEL